MTNAFFIKRFPSLQDKLSKLALVKCLLPANCHSASSLLSERCRRRFFFPVRGSGLYLNQKHLPEVVIQSLPCVPFLLQHLVAESWCGEEAFNGSSAKLAGMSPVTADRIKQ